MKRLGVVCAWVVLWANVVAAAGPIVFHVSDPVGPDETALLFGDGLAGVSVEGCVLHDEPVAGPPEQLHQPSQSAWRQLDVLQTSDLCAEGPPAGRLAARDLFHPREELVGRRPGRAQRYRALVVVGRTGRRCRAGGTIRVFGKNLGEKPAAWLLGERNTIRLTPLENDLPSARDISAASRCPPISRQASTNYGSITGMAVRWASVAR